MALLFKAHPHFDPENIFTVTQSRLQVSPEVLFNRVAALRPSGILTPADEVLRAKFVNLESRLLYFRFGPDVIADCIFCTSDDPQLYLYYALPSLLWPHILNLLVVAVVTSSACTGRYGQRWRVLGVLAACTLAAVDIYAVASYNHSANLRASRLDSVYFFHWHMRRYRLGGLAAFDLLLAVALYLTSTNRLFVQEPSLAERVEMASRQLLAARSKVSVVGVLRNVSLRDEELRSQSQAYWTRETQLMREVMEDRDVVDGVNDALSNRINIQDITRDADAWTRDVLQSAQGVKI